MFIASLVQATPSQPTADYTPQLIGVLGTLLGVFLGWCLNYFTNNKGKIRIYVDQEKYLKNENEQFVYIIALSIYNKSLKQRSISKIKIQFLNCKQKLHEEIPREKDNTDDFIGINSQKQVSITNIKPFEYRTINLCGIIAGENYKTISKANKILLSYSSENNHIHSLLVDKNFSLNSTSTDKNIKRFD